MNSRHNKENYGGKINSTKFIGGGGGGGGGGRLVFSVLAICDLGSGARYLINL